MRCENAQYYFDDYVDGVLSFQQVSLFENHLSECSICRNRLQQHTVYLAALSRFEVPAPHSSTVKTLLHTGQTIIPKKWPVWLHGLVAASIMSVILLTGLWSVDRYWHESAYTVKAIEASRLIDVSITAPMDMDDVMLTLVLPEGLALDGFDDIGEITWRVDLKSGINNLSLPVRFLAKRIQQTVINIDVLMNYRDREKRFQIGINVHSSVNEWQGTTLATSVTMNRKV